MKYYHIWMEGYVATGQSSKAQCLTDRPILAENFDKAVEKYAEETGTQVDKNTRSRYRTSKAFKERKSNWSIWGCDLFPDETSARKAFG